MSAQTVLIVEDDPGTRKLLRITLESYGCRVLEARDGASAVDRLDDAPDLVVQTLLLPDMDGLTLRERIRERRPDTPVIAISGYAQRLFGDQASAAGFADRLRKPVEPSALLSAVQAWLPAVGNDVARGTARVLVVDDTDIQRKLTVLRLRDAGYDVLECADGLSALDLAQREVPDLILTDVLMPGLDGFELCRRIADHGATAGTPVVLASSVFVEEADRDLAVRAGAVGYVTREPDMAEILEAVRRALVDPPVSVDTTADYDELHAQRLGRALAHQAAEHSSLEDELTRRDAQLAVLTGISETLARATDPATVMEEILARCVEATGVAGAQFRASTPAGGPTVPPVTVGDPPSVPQDAVEVAAREDRTIVRDDGIVIGLRNDGTDLGVVVLGSRGEPFTGEQVQLCQAIARQLCQAVALARGQAELVGSREETIERLATAVDFRDGGTADHVRRMSQFSSVIARTLGLPPERCELLRIASAMHDIGKVATPDAILLKEGRLTDEERVEIQRHAEIGHAILSGSGSELLEMAATIALSHHERWDGAGYPRGLRGTEIPLEGRIAAVADVFDALISDRPYRPAMPLADALRIVRSGRATHFDPAVLDAFEEAVDELTALGGFTTPAEPWAAAVARGARAPRDAGARARAASPPPPRAPRAR